MENEFSSVLHSTTVDGEDMDSAEGEVRPFGNDCKPPGSIPEEAPPRSTVILCNEGDVLLETADLTVLVSSTTLCMASQFFAKLLQPGGFLEGEQLPSPITPPTKRLEIKDSQSLLVICKVLHFQNVEEPADVAELVAIADMCDYLLCQNALRFHGRNWIRRWTDNRRLQAHSLSQLLWVSYVFDSADTFSTFSGRLATVVTQDDLRQLQLHPSLERVRDQVGRLKMELLLSICQRVQESIKVLLEEQDEKRYVCKGYLICNRCQQRKPEEAKKCHGCGSHDLAGQSCHSTARVCWLIGWLEHNKIWPLSERKSDSCQSLQDELGVYDSGSLFHTWWTHECDGHNLCPLYVEKRALHKDVTSLLGEVQGLDLRDFKQT